MIHELNLTGEPKLTPKAAKDHTLVWSVSQDGTRACGTYEDSIRALHGFHCRLFNGQLVTGSAITIDVAPKEFLDAKGKLPPPRPHVGTSIRDINDAGDMVGLYVVGPFDERGFAYLNDHSLYWMGDGQFSQGLGINNDRVMVGTFGPTKDTSMAVAMHAGPQIAQRVNLNQNVAHDIDSHGNVVGMTATGAFVMEINRNTLQPKPLTPPHWAVLENSATAITSRSFVGTGSDKDETVVGFAVESGPGKRRRGFIVKRKKNDYASEDVNFMDVEVPMLAGGHCELTGISDSGKVICGFHGPDFGRDGPKTSFIYVT